MGTRPAETNNGVTTSWLPMTTAWPSSAGCEKSLWKKVSTILAAWDPGYGLSVQHGLSCHPPEMTQWWNAPMLGVDTKATQYSMGPVVCPKAYTTATKSTMGGGSTLVGCCPSGYTFVSFKDVGKTGQCTSKLAGKQVVKFATYVSSKWMTTSSTVPSASAAFAIPINGWLLPDLPAPTPVVPGVGLLPTNNGPPIPTVAGEEPTPLEPEPEPTPPPQPITIISTISSDGTIVSLVTIESTPVESTVIPAAETTPPTPTESSTSSASDPNLGIKVGIPAASAAAVLIIGSVIFFFLRRKRRETTSISKKRKQRSAGSESGINTLPPEMYGDEQYMMTPTTASKGDERSADTIAPDKWTDDKSYARRMSKAELHGWATPIGDDAVSAITRQGDGWNTPKTDADAWSLPPAEMAVPQNVHVVELPATPARFQPGKH